MQSFFGYYVKREMPPLVIELSEKEIAKDPTAALFKCNVLIQKHHSETEQQPSTKKLNHRGVVSSINKGSINFKDENGMERK